MVNYYSENLEPKQSTVQQLLMFSKAVKSIQSNILNNQIVFHLN